VGHYTTALQSCGMMDALMTAVGDPITHRGCS